MAISGAPAHPTHATRVNRQQPGLPLASSFLFAFGDWVYSIAIVILAFHLSDGLAAAAAVLLLHAGGRLLVMTFSPSYDVSRRIAQLAPVLEVGRAALIAALIFVTADDQLWVAMTVATLIGVLNPLIENAHAQRGHPVAHTARRGASLRERLICRWDQIAMISGSITGGLLIATWSERPAFALAALVSLVAAFAMFRRSPENSAITSATRQPRTFNATSPPTRSRTLHVFLLALAAGAAMGIAIRVLMIEIVLDDHGGTELIYGMFIALAGAGAFAGPLSIPRLLGRMPSEILLGGVTAALAFALVAAHLVDPLALAIPIILGCGVLAITGERAGETVIRRIVPDRELDGALRLLTIVTIIGQTVALTVISAAHYLSGTTLVVVSLSAISIVCAVIPILMYVRTTSQSIATGDD